MASEIKGQSDVAAGKAGLIAGNDEIASGNLVITLFSYSEFCGGREGECVDVTALLGNPSGSNQGFSIVDIFPARGGKRDGAQSENNTQNNRKDLFHSTTFIGIIPLSVVNKS